MTEELFCVILEHSYYDQTKPREKKLSFCLQLTAAMRTPCST